MTSVNLKDIAQEALATVIVSDLALIVICFFAYTIVPPESLNGFIAIMSYGKKSAMNTKKENQWQSKMV